MRSVRNSRRGLQLFITVNHMVSAIDCAHKANLHKLSRNVVGFGYSTVPTRDRTYSGAAFDLLGADLGCLGRKNGEQCSRCGQNHANCLSVRYVVASARLTV